MIDIIIFVLVLTLIIFIHELGHFIFAKKAEIMCYEFAIGMGPAIYEKRKGETVYAIRAIPLGGYVSMAGEGTDDYVRIGNRVGVNFNHYGQVKEIVLNNDTERNLIGEVVDFNLKNDSEPLFITLKNESEVIRFEVIKELKYILSPKKEILRAPMDRSFENKTLWQRFLVVFAGPAMNFILAFFILFILAFFIGKPSNSTKLGNVNQYLVGENINVGDEVSAVNGKVVNSWQELSNEINNNNNYQATLTINGVDHIINIDIIMQGIGLRNEIGNDKLIVGEVFGRDKNILKGDLIKSATLSNNKVNNQPYINLNTWEEFLTYLINNQEKEYIHLQVERNDAIIDVSYQTIIGSTLEKLNNSYIVYNAGIVRERNFNILYPLYYPFQAIWSDVSEVFGTLGLLFNPNSGVGVGDLSGPIGIFGAVSSYRKQGVVTFFGFVAFLSINIGMLNLLPIPALDGGRLLFIGYEAITKKKVSKRIENLLISVTFILLFALMIFVSIKDVFRLF